MIGRLFFSISLSLLLSTAVQAQREIDWNYLAKTKFEKKRSAELDQDYWLPTFPPEILQLDRDLVTLKGYLIVLDTRGELLALSANPFSSCFFCGAAGPESVMELRPRKRYPNLRTDQVVWVKGRMKLNAGDPDQMNYILEDAVITNGPDY